MKKIVSVSSFLLFCLAACTNNTEEAPKSENDVDAVRNFIQSSLYGDYEKAKKYMIHDSINLGLMNTYEERVVLSSDEKRGFASASINIHDVNRPNDSTTIVIYSNSYKNNWDTLKVIRQNGEWLVDFKYLFNHSMDTLMNPSANKDSIR